MGRDHRKLRVFSSADELVLDVYRLSAPFPREERFGLQSQLRRAALSTATNIVEGSARRTTREYVHFLNIAFASASEADYLIDVAYRLEMLPAGANTLLRSRYDELLKGLQSLINALDCQSS